MIQLSKELLLTVDFPWNRSCFACYCEWHCDCHYGYCRWHRYFLQCPHQLSNVPFPILFPRFQH